MNNTILLDKIKCPWCSTVCEYNLRDMSKYPVVIQIFVCPICEYIFDIEDTDE